MITSLRLVNFKNFADETLRVGPFTVIVGANASGKSNIRDAFRFLHGIGRGYTLAEIMGGKYGLFGKVEWEGIRGDHTELVRIVPGSVFEPSAFSVHVEFNLDGRGVNYSIKVGIDMLNHGPYVLEEELRIESENIYTTAQTRDPGLWLFVGDDGEDPILLSRFEPALTQIPEKHPTLWRWFVEEFNIYGLFSSIRFFDPSPEFMREPSPPNVGDLGDSGENLPTVLEEICRDRGRLYTLTSWVQELTPMDVGGFDFPRDPKGRVYLVIHETNGRQVSADSASDGTLRFLAVLAALLGPNPARVCFFEEIDNGIHPARLHLLIDLLERQTAKNGIQVITTTHSPDVLNFINDRTFEHTSVVSRLEDSADAIIRPVDSLHNARELRKSQGLGRLHSTGWMEDILNMEAWKIKDEEVGE